MTTEATINEQYRALMDVVPAQAVLMLAALIIAVGKAMYGFSSGDPSLRDVFGLVGGGAWVVAVASGLAISAHSGEIKRREEALVRARLRSDYGQRH